MIVITDHQNIHYFILIHIFVPNFILLCSILEKGAQSFKVLLGDSNLNLDFQYGVQELGIAKAISHQHYKDSTTNNIGNCQGLSISQSLNLSLSLRDRADTIITLYHTTPHHHQHLFIGDLYSSVIHHWNRQLKPYSFPLRKNRLN